MPSSRGVGEAGGICGGDSLTEEQSLAAQLLTPPWRLAAERVAARRSWAAAIFCSDSTRSLQHSVHVFMFDKSSATAQGFGPSDVVGETSRLLHAKKPNMYTWVAQPRRRSKTFCRIRPVRLNGCLPVSAPLGESRSGMSRILKGAVYSELSQPCAARPLLLRRWRRCVR